METLDKYPSHLLLPSLFLVAILVHVWIISGIQPDRPTRASITMKQAVRMTLRNTWKPPVQPARIQQKEKKAAPARPAAEKRTPKKPAPPLKPVEKKQQDQIIEKPAPEPLPPPEPEPNVQSQQKEEPPVTETVQPVKETAEAAEEPVQDLPEPKPVQSQPKEARTITDAEPAQSPTLAAVTQQERVDVDWNRLVKQYIDRIDIQDYYPSRARRKRQQGTVIIRVTLSKEARVRTVAIDRSSRYASLDKAALSLIRTNRTELEQILESKKLFLNETVQLRLPIRFALR